ncbi:hypothetical protein D3C72_2448950 [compost metagenome]
MLLQVFIAFKKFLNDFLRLPGHCNDLRFVPYCFLYFIDMGHQLNTGTAVGIPKIKDQNLVLIIIQIYGTGWEI